MDGGLEGEMSCNPGKEPYWMREGWIEGDWEKELFAALEDGGETRDVMHWKGGAVPGAEPSLELMDPAV